MQDNPRSNFQTLATGKLVVGNVNIETAGQRGPCSGTSG
jgi:hypothetical protein